MNTYINKKIIIYLLIYISFIISFIFGENSSGGSIQDFHQMKIYQKELSKNISQGILFFIESGQGHSPAFYIIKAILGKFLNDLTIDIIFLSLSFTIPMVFYTVLKKKFRGLDKNVLFLISIVFYLSPYIRSSASWTTNDNFAILFFLLSLSKFISFTTSEKKRIKNTLLCSIYLIVATYTRQYYLIIFIFYGFFLLKNNDIKLFFNIALFNLILLTPGFVYLYKFFYFNLFVTTYTNNYVSGGFLKIDLIFKLLIFFTLYLFYIFPFFVNLKSYNLVKKLIKNNKVNLLLLSIFFILIYFNYTIVPNQFGGGVIYKISLFLNSKILFIFSSFVGLLLILATINLNLKNLFILAIFVFMFPFAIIYQKYYDPLMIIMFFGIMQSDLIYNKINSKKINMAFVFVYFLFFLIGSNIYYEKQGSRNYDQKYGIINKIS
jgi:hypothetical protein